MLPGSPRPSPLPVFLAQSVCDTMEKMSDTTSWLVMLEAESMMIPTVVDDRCFELDLDMLSVMQVIAVVQGALYQAGYRIRNMVRDYNDPVLAIDDLPEFEVRMEARQLLTYLRAELDEWIKWTAQAGFQVVQSGVDVPVPQTPIVAVPMPSVVSPAQAARTPAEMSNVGVQDLQASQKPPVRRLRSKTPGISDSESSADVPVSSTQVQVKRNYIQPSTVAAVRTRQLAMAQSGAVQAPQTAPALAARPVAPVAPPGVVQAPQVASSVAAGPATPAVSAAAPSVFPPSMSAPQYQFASGVQEALHPGAAVHVPSALTVPVTPATNAATWTQPVVGSYPSVVMTQQPTSYVTATTQRPAPHVTFPQEQPVQRPALGCDEVSMGTVSDDDLPWMVSNGLSLRDVTTGVNAPRYANTGTNLHRADAAGYLPATQSTQPRYPARAVAAPPAQVYYADANTGAPASGMLTSQAPVPVASRRPVERPVASAPMPISSYSQPVVSAGSPAQSYAMPAPAYQSAPAPAYAPQSPVWFRPYIDRRSLDDFYGTESVSESKQWLHTFLYLAQAGVWTDIECCRNMDLYLRGSAKSWYNQLGERRLNWHQLQREFKNEFCKSSSSYVEQYYQVEHRDGLTPRQLLWRLNEAAARARLDFKTGDGLRHHVARFIRVLRDQDIKASLIGRSFTHIKELEDNLRLFEEQLGRDRRQEKTRLARRPVEGMKPVSKPQAPLAYYAYDEDNDDADQDRLIDRLPGRGVRFPDEQEPEFEDDERDEGDAYVVAPGGRSPRYTGNSAGFSRQGAGLDQRQTGYSPRPSPRNPGLPQCFECKGYGHISRDCPNRTRCELCKMIGHEASTCWRKCPLCGQVHTDETCSVLLELKEWVKTKDGTVDLPPPLSSSS